MAVVFCIFAIWLALTVVFQFPGRFQSRIGRLNSFSLLPSWSFFAPNPGVHDYRLLYRDKTALGKWTDWAEITPLATNRFARVVWHPEKHDQKVLNDTVQHLMETVRVLKGEIEPVLVTWPYLVLLNAVMNQPNSSDARVRQFSLVASSGHRNPRSLELVFLSFEHSFDTE